MNILDVALAGRIAASGGGGGSGTDNYNDLSNLPQINGETLAGNKSSSNLGLQDEIDSDHKLSSDLVDDANHTNKFVTSTEKQTWSAKQNAIDADHKLSSDLVDDANKTNKFVTSTEKQTWNNKQNAIDLDHKLSSSLVSFTTAEAAALASGIDSAKVGQISTNQTNILYVLGKTGKNLLSKSTLAISGSTWHDIEPIKAGSYIVTGRLPNTASHYSIDFRDENDNDVGSFAGVGWSTLYNDGMSLTLTGTATKVKIWAAGTSSGDELTTAMVCTPEDWAVGHDYAPYAKPNYDLTRLEAEDRAALAEVVDSGAKNTAEIYNVTQNAITITTSASKATFSGSASQDGSITWGKIHANTTGDHVVYCNMSTSAGRFTVYNKTDSVILRSFYPADNKTPIVLSLVAGKEYTVYSWFAAGTASDCVIDLMICTKAAFCVSQKFVPYQWSATDVLDKNSADMPKFNDDISLMFYHNAQQHQCVLVFKTTTKESITGGTACYIGNVTNIKYMPKGTVRAYTIASGYSAALTKNSTNIVIAFSCHSGTIPSGTTIDTQLEWTYI